MGNTTYTTAMVMQLIKIKSGQFILLPGFAYKNTDHASVRTFGSLAQ
jgi:hypothetical protein